MTALINVVYYTVLNPMADQMDKDNKKVGEKTVEAELSNVKFPHYGYLNGEIFCDMNDYLNENGEFEEAENNGFDLDEEEKREDIKMEQKEAEIGDGISIEVSTDLNINQTSVMRTEEEKVDKNIVDRMEEDLRNQEGKRKKVKDSVESPVKLIRFLSHTASRAFASLASNTSTTDCIQYLLTQHIIVDIHRSESPVMANFDIPRDFLYHLLDKAAVTTKSAGMSDIAIVEESLVMKLIERRKILYQVKLKKNSIINNLNITKANVILNGDKTDLTLPTPPPIQPSTLSDELSQKKSQISQPGGEGEEKLDINDTNMINFGPLLAKNDAAHDTIAQASQLKLLDLIHMSDVHEDIDDINVLHNNISLNNQIPPTQIPPNPDSIESAQSYTPPDIMSPLPPSTTNLLTGDRLGFVQRDAEATSQPSSPRRSAIQSTSPARRALLLLAQEQAQLAEEIAQEDREMEQHDREQSGASHTMYSAALQGMGFPAGWCEMALDCCGGDFDEALNYILSNGEALEQMTFNSDIQRANASAEVEESTNIAGPPGGTEPAVGTFSGGLEEDTGDMDLLEDSPQIEGLGSYEMIADVRSESESLLIQGEEGRPKYPSFGEQGSSSSLMDIGNDSSDEDDEERGKYASLFDLYLL
jgi:hypothetical protein